MINTKDCLYGVQRFSPMRKLPIYLSLCCLLVIVCAFRSASPPIILTEADNGHAVTVAPGTQIIVRLADISASTGFAWSLNTPSNQVLQLRGKKTIPWINPPGQPPRVGAPGTIEFTFLAQHSGTIQLQFAQRQPWEKVKPAAKTFAATIHVRATMPR